jgi:hypothetical protein
MNENDSDEDMVDVAQLRDAEEQVEEEDDPDDPMDVDAHAAAEDGAQIDVDEDEDDHEDELDTRVQAINDNTTSARTKAVYSSKQVAFVQFLGRQHADVLGAWFAEAKLDDHGNVDKALVKEVLQRKGNASPPILFESLDARIITRFVASLKKANGDDASTSVTSTARSAIADLFRTWDFVPSAELSAALKKFYRGLKRKAAKDAGEGRRKDEIGKKPMTISIFSFLCEFLLTQGTTEFIFLHTLLVISWNLMCR